MLNCSSTLAAELAMGPSEGAAPGGGGAGVDGLLGDPAAIGEGRRDPEPEDDLLAFLERVRWGCCGENGFGELERRNEGVAVVGE